MEHSEDCFQGFYLSFSLTLYCNSSIRFPELLRSLFSTSRLLFCAVSVTSHKNILMPTQFHSIFNKSNSFPGFPFWFTLVFIYNFSKYHLTLLVCFHFVWSILNVFRTFLKVTSATIFCHKVVLDAQLMNFFIWNKNNVSFSRYLDFCVRVKSTDFKICDIIISIAT